MNILGIDFGQKRVGLAWVDTALGVVLPYGRIDEEGENKKLEKISDLVNQENIDKVVVGLPLGLDGKENNNTNKVRDFVNKLSERIGQEISLVDERFSSQEADRLEGEASRDEKSAMLVLQTYIESSCRN